MSSYQGSGAGQAVEDAYILATVLADPRTTLSTLPVALKVYEEIRLPHANEVMRRSQRSADICTFDDPSSSWLTGASPDELDPGKLWDVGYDLLENWRWAWATSIDGDQARALQMLHERFMVPNKS